jgi:hypothetical protein
MGAHAAARHTSFLAVIDDLLWKKHMTSGGRVAKKYF